MKKIIAFLTIFIPLQMFGDVPVTDFYIFHKSDFEHFILRDGNYKEMKIEDLKETAIRKSNKLFLSGRIKSWPVDLDISTGDMSYQLKFYMGGEFRNSPAIIPNKLAYEISISSKILDKETEVIGSFVQVGKSKWKINKDWKKSELVIILISRNLNK